MFDFPTKVPRIAGKLIRSKKANLSTFVYLDCRSLHKVHSFLKQCCARSSFPSKQSTSCSWFQKGKSAEVACFGGNENRAQQCFKNEWTLKARVNNEGLLTFLPKRLWEWRQIVSLDKSWIILPFQIRRLWLYYFYFSISFYILSFWWCNFLRLTRSGQGQFQYI